MVIRRISIEERLKELGAFRNVLVHLYQTIETDMLHENYHKALKTFPLFTFEILAWLDANA